MKELVKLQRSAGDMHPSRGFIDTERFLLWVNQRLVPNLRPGQVVVMDNASIHMHLDVDARIRAAGCVLVYTAPYSPDLNRIEFCFRQYKAYLKRHYKKRQFWVNFCHFHAVVMLSITKDDMCIYCRRIGCIRNVPVVLDAAAVRRRRRAVAVAALAVVCRSVKIRRLIKLLVSLCMQHCGSLIYTVWRCTSTAHHG